MEKILEQQAQILRQQSEIIAWLRALKEELNTRLEINERSIRQIDEQLALANELRRNELDELKPILERLELLEEFLRLDVATHLITSHKQC